jgi:predicted permease
MSPPRHQPDHRPDPPRLARLLLQHALPDDVREDVVGDLDEVFQKRCGEHGVLRAQAWYVRESLAFAARFGLQRLRERRLRERSHGPRSPLADTLFRDARMALRRVRHRPGFAVIVVLTLAFGIGANAAIYQVVEAVSLRSLPVRDPEQLAIVELADMTRWEGRRTSGYPVLSNPLWERIRDERGPFETTLAWASADFRVESSDGPAAVRGLYVSGDFFDALGISPALGRTFRADDDRHGCGLPGVVLGHGFWQRRFGGDPSVIGRTMVLHAHDVPILGVTPAGFSGLEVGRDYDVAVPICAQQLLGADEEWLENGMVWWLTVMGRVPSGRPLETVNAELEAWSSSLFESTLPAAYPRDRRENYLSQTLRAVPGAAGVSSVRTRYGDSLLALLMVTGLVLLIACTNLANLFLARGSARQRELAVRRALGASEGRLLGELSIESLMLAAAGATGGLALAGVLSGPLLDSLGSDLSLDLSLEGSTVAFVVLVAALSCLIFGVMPAWRAVSSATRGAGLRRALVVSQVALSFVLLFGALLFTSTLRNLLAVDTGFDSEGVTVARVDFTTLEVPESARSAFKRDLLERLAAAPGVTSAAEVRHVPLGGTGSGATMRPIGPDPAAGVPVRLNAITPGYLETMGIPLTAGRDFDPRDPLDAPTAIINPTFAARLGLGPNPVGQTILVEELDLPLEIIGLVPDTKYFTLREDPIPIAFVTKGLLSDARPYTHFVLRSALPPAALRQGLREALTPISSRILLETRPFDDTLRAGLTRERLLSSLSSFFGILAALVAALGLYGVMSYHVAQRKADIGVRIAFGAKRGDILLMVLRQGGALLGGGLLLGGALALVASIPARAFLFGLQLYPIATYALAAGLLSVTAAVAGYLPARRAAGLEVREALRGE